MNDSQTNQGHPKEWIDDDEVQALLKWLEACTLAELLMAKEFIEKQRERFQ